MAYFDLYFGFEKVIQEFQRDVNNELEIPITVIEERVLRLLVEEGKISSSEIAYKLNHSTSSISILLGKLEKKNLIQRTHSTKDRRKVFVQHKLVAQNLIQHFAQIRGKYTKQMEDVFNGFQKRGK